MDSEFRYGDGSPGRMPLRGFLGHCDRLPYSRGKQSAESAISGELDFTGCSQTDARSRRTGAFGVLEFHTVRHRELRFFKLRPCHGSLMRSGGHPQFTDCDAESAERSGIPADEPGLLPKCERHGFRKQNGFSVLDRYFGDSGKQSASLRRRM